MKARITLALWVLAVTLCACGRGGSGSSNGGVSMAPPPAPAPTPPAMQTGNLTVTSLVPLATSSSESDEPLTVDTGIITLGPTDDETSDPIALK